MNKNFLTIITTAYLILNFSLQGSCHKTAQQTISVTMLHLPGEPMGLRIVPKLGRPYCSFDDNKPRKNIMLCNQSKCIKGPINCENLHTMQLPLIRNVKFTDDPSHFTTHKPIPVIVQDCNNYVVLFDLSKTLNPPLLNKGPKRCKGKTTFANPGYICTALAAFSIYGKDRYIKNKFKTQGAHFIADGITYCIKDATPDGADVLYDGNQNFYKEYETLHINIDHRKLLNFESLDIRQGILLCGGLANICPKKPSKYVRNTINGHIPVYCFNRSNIGPALKLVSQKLNCRYSIGQPCTICRKQHPNSTDCRNLHATLVPFVDTPIEAPSSIASKNIISIISQVIDENIMLFNYTEKKDDTINNSFYYDQNGMPRKGLVMTEEPALEYICPIIAVAPNTKDNFSILSKPGTFFTMNGITYFLAKTVRMVSHLKSYGCSDCYYPAYVMQSTDNDIICGGVDDYQDIKQPESYIDTFVPQKPLKTEMTDNEIEKNTKLVEHYINCAISMHLMKSITKKLASTSKIEYAKDLLLWVYYVISHTWRLFIIS